VGGIPEQIVALDGAGVQLESRTLLGGDGTAGNRDVATGALVPLGDAAGMARVTVTLLNDRSLLADLGRNAAQRAVTLFDRTRMRDDYLNFYEAMLSSPLIAARV
jgi:glycosyltransferase involved in cell wall biosynthesis